MKISTVGCNRCYIPRIAEPPPKVEPLCNIYHRQKLVGRYHFFRIPVVVLWATLLAVVVNSRATLKAPHYFVLLAQTFCPMGKAARR
jgi:hypothetical protein